MSRIIKFTLLSTLILFSFACSLATNLLYGSAPNPWLDSEVDSSTDIIADKGDGLLFVSILDASPGTTVLLGWNKK